MDSINIPLPFDLPCREAIVILGERPRLQLPVVFPPLYFIILWAYLIFLYEKNSTFSKIKLWGHLTVLYEINSI